MIITNQDDYNKSRNSINTRLIKIQDQLMILRRDCMKLALAANDSRMQVITLDALYKATDEIQKVRDYI